MLTDRTPWEKALHDAVTFASVHEHEHVSVSTNNLGNTLNELDLLRDLRDEGQKMIAALRESAALKDQEIARLRDALEQIEEICHQDMDTAGAARSFRKACGIARSALGQDDDGDCEKEA